MEDTLFWIECACDGDKRAAGAFTSRFCRGDVSLEEAQKSYDAVNGNAAFVA